MADVKWIKITTDMFEDEKIDFITSLPESDAILVIWIRLLALAGKCNSGGYIHLTETIPYTEDMLAHKFRKSPNIIKLSLETFKRLGMLDLDEGGLFLPNWDKHQNVEGLEKIKEQTAARVAKHRKQKKLLSGNTEGVTRSVTHVTQECNVTVTQGNATELDIELDKELDIINNDNNARVGVEIEINVNDSEETLSEISQTTTETPQMVNESNETVAMSIGTQARNWAQKNWGRPLSPGESGEIIAGCDEFYTRGSSEPDAVMIEALQQCDFAGVRNMKYLHAVLVDWRDDGILTVAQVEARENGRKGQKVHKRGNKDPDDNPPRPPRSSKYEKFYL